VAAFNRAQERFYLEAIYQGDYYEGLAKLRTALAARVAPALSHVIGEVIPYLAEAGVLQPLDDLPGARDLDLHPALGQSGTWHGGGERPLVCLPFNRSTPIAYLNGALFQAAGLSAPRTWDELVQVTRRLTVRRPSGEVDRYGFGCPIDWWFWVALLGQAGGELGRIQPLGNGSRRAHAAHLDSALGVDLGGDAGVEALELWQRMVARERAMKPPPGRDYNAWEQTNQDFLAGRTAMIWTSTAFLRYLEKNASFPVIAAPLPAFRRRAVPTGGTHWVIPRSAPDAEKEAAWAFLRFLHEPAQAITWATETGYLPVTQGAVRELEARGYYRAHPNDRVALEQLAVARPWPWAPDLFRLQREIVQPALEEAVLGGQDARAVFERARGRAAQEFG
jgi:sn-glycerol 3-phosphate transport system substrate-binding protein